MEFVYNWDFSWQDGRYVRNWTVTVMLQIQSVNSKRLWEKGMKCHQCFRCLTLPRHEELFTTRGITEKTIVGSHLGDRFVKVCKTFGAKQILRLYNKKENSLYQTYVPMIFCSCFLLYSFLYSRYTYSTHSIYKLFSSHPFLTTDHLTYIFSSS
jgi:hypothetical protein